MKALTTLLVATGILACASTSDAAGAAYRHYVGCGLSSHSHPAHSCARASKKAAFFKSSRRDVLYTVCIRFPSGHSLCAKRQRAEQGTLYVNRIDSRSVGKHRATWFVKGKRVGTFAFWVKGPPGHRRLPSG